MKKIIFLFICILTINNMYSQDSGNKGVQSIDLTGHYTQYGGAFSIGYNERIGNRMNVKVKINHERGKVKIYDYKIYSLIPSFAYSIININSKFYLNAEIGGLMSVEAVKNYEPQNYLNKTVFGGVGGVEAVFACKNVSFLINGHEFLTTGSNLFSNRFQVGAGIRIHLQ